MSLPVFEPDGVPHAGRSLCRRYFGKRNVITPRKPTPSGHYPGFRQTSPTAVPSSACFNTKAICASENFDAFMELSFSPSRDHKWKIPAKNGPIQRGHVNGVSALRANGTSVEFKVFPGVAHGFGLGTGTSAERWIEDAAAFWGQFVRDD